MVTITTPVGHPTAIHTGGSAGHPDATATRESEPGSSTSAATIVTLSDRAKQLVADVEAAQAVLDILAMTNGVARDGDSKASQSSAPQVLIAHDATSNEGLYITWSDVG